MCICVRQFLCHFLQWWTSIKKIIDTIINSVKKILSLKLIIKLILVLLCYNLYSVKKTSFHCNQAKEILHKFNFFTVPPVCSPQGVKVYGVAKMETAHIACNVESNPPDVTFRSFFYLLNEKSSWVYLNRYKNVILIIVCIVLKRKFQNMK